MYLHFIKWTVVSLFTSTFSTANYQLHISHHKLSRDSHKLWYHLIFFIELLLNPSELRRGIIHPRFWNWWVTYHENTGVWFYIVCSLLMLNLRVLCLESIEYVFYVTFSIRSFRILFCTFAGGRWAAELQNCMIWQ